MAEYHGQTRSLELARLNRMMRTCIDLTVGWDREAMGPPQILRKEKKQT